MARCNLDCDPNWFCPTDCDCTGLECFTGTVNVTSSGGTVSGTLTTSTLTIDIQQTVSVCGPTLLSVNGMRASVCGTFIRVGGEGVLDVQVVFLKPSTECSSVRSGVYTAQSTMHTNAVFPRRRRL